MKLEYKEVQICRICGYISKSITSLGAHIQYNHKDYNMNKYYDEFYKTQKEGTCKVCGKETKFKSLINGYNEYCGKSCAHKTEHFRSTYQESILKRTEEDNKEWRDKILNTKKNRYKNGKCISDKELKNRENKSKQHFIDYLTKAKCSLIKINKDKDRNYINSITFRCDVCKRESTYVRSLIDRYNRKEDYKICHFCNNRKSISIPERELRTFIYKEYGGEVILNDRNILQNGELDIVLPEKKIAIEMDGLYWHNETCVDNDYHVKKTNECEKKGYQLIHIFDDEWQKKRAIVESRLKSILGSNERIFARKCNIKEISYKECKNFLTENHIQGNCQSKFRYGLFYNNELVSVMTFGKSRFKNEMELIRFCNKLNTNVIGGASKLFKYFTENHKDINNIITFADRRWSMGNLYEKMNFKKININEPSYFYIINHERKNRIEYQKHKLVKMGYDKNKSEKQIMNELGYKRIYDCGTIKYEWYRQQESL